MTKKIKDLISEYKEVEKANAKKELKKSQKIEEEEDKEYEEDKSDNSSDESDKESDNGEKKEKISQKTFRISSGLQFKVLNNLDEKAELGGIFPNGNIIEIIDVSKTSYNSIVTKIKIRDSNYALLQEIKDAHKHNIISLSIKDNDNFITYSCDRKIKIWSKENNKFKLIEEIEENKYKSTFKGEVYEINNIKFLKDGKIISTFSGSIKIYNKIKSCKYQLMLTINIYTTSFKIRKNIISILEHKVCNNYYDYYDKNRKKLYLFVFCNLKNYKFLNKFKYENSHSVIKFDFLDKNRIIIFTDGPNIEVLSLETKKIIKVIENQSECELEGDLFVVQKKHLFLIGGYNINVYNSANYELIETVRPPFPYDIKIFIPNNEEEVGIIWQKWTA